MKWIFAFALLIVLFGCLKPFSGPEQNQTLIPPEQNITLPQQNITPPVAPPQQNVTPPQNETPQQNYTPPPPPPPQEQPSTPSTNLSISELLTQELDAIPTPSGGPYTTKKYTWVSYEFEANGTNIELNPTYTVLFNNKSEKDLIGLAFRVYTPQTGHSFADGVAITANRSVMLDEFTASSQSIELEFLFPGLERILKGVVFVSEDDILDSRNRTIAIYQFEAANAG